MKMTRKSETLKMFQDAMLKQIESYINEPRDSKFLPPELELLAFSFKHHFFFTAIVLAHGQIKCNNFNSIYFVWSDLQGKSFLEHQNAESYFVNKSLQFKNVAALQNLH